VLKERYVALGKVSVWDEVARAAGLLCENCMALGIQLTIVAVSPLKVDLLNGIDEKV